MKSNEAIGCGFDPKICGLIGRERDTRDVCVGEDKLRKSSYLQTKKRPQEDPQS